MQEINNLTLKDAAKKYIEMGFGVVPRTPNGRAFLIPKDTGEPGNINKPLTTAEQIEAVWNETPDANISIVDEGLIIFDVDQHENSNGVAQMKEMDLPKTLSQWTPNKGLHLFYRNPKKTKYRKIGNGLDIISGHHGLIVAPSVVDGKAYRWANQREMKPCPIELENSEKMADDKGEIPGYIFEGERNNQLTRIAGIYAGRGLDYDQVFEGVWGANLNRCSKPLDKSEVHRIVASIMNSEESKEDNLKARIEEFIEDEPGFFTIAQLDAELGIKQDEKNYRKQILHRLCNEGKLERGNQRGLYRIKNKNKKGMNFMRIKKAEISLPLPLDLSNYTRVAPKNIIIIAGATNAGKTTFVMNIIHSILNCNAVKITDLTGQSATRNAKISENYIISDSTGGKPLSMLLGEQITGTSSAVDLLFMNSEMSEIELSQRFSEFPGGVESFDHPNFEVVERESNFEDIVNPDGVNIIDYLPVHDKFWLVADKIKKIHDRLNKGIAVICIQKRSDKPFARGGEFTLELCRLGIALDNNSPYGHICTILKNKIPLDPRNKLGGESRDFKIGGGACIRAISEWRYIKDKKERERVNSFYAVEPENEAEFEPDEFMGEAV